MIKRILKTILLLSLGGILLAAAATLLAGLYYYFRLTRDLPRIEKLSDYMPRAVSAIYADDGTLIGETFGERRYPVKLSEVPLPVRNAFLAAEDANFYSHPGVDLVSIARAMWVNFQRKATRQGASTITQQVVKSLLLSRERTYERKAKEALLAYRLEKALTKDEIFEIYLNEIFLGAHAYGLKAAAQSHFHRELSKLSLAQAALLAGLPQRPSDLVLPKYRAEALRRRSYVLSQMYKNGMISLSEREEADKEELVLHPPDLNGVYGAAYFETHAMKVADETLRTLDRRFSLKSPGGFQVRTAVDLGATGIAERALRRGLREVDKRRGWRGPYTEADRERRYYQRQEGDAPRKPEPTSIGGEEVVPAKILAVNGQRGTVDVLARGLKGSVEVRAVEWAKRFLNSKDETSIVEPLKLLKPGLYIDVVLQPGKYEGKVSAAQEPLSLQLDQLPEIEGAFVLLNPLTGAVRTIIGGYDYDRNEFNRATQGLLQPGSAFKPFIYLAALENLNFTPSTIVPDSPISLVAGQGKLWTPGNFDGKFLGPITLRTALARSRNVVAVHLLNRLGVDRGIETAHRLGITTPIDRNMSIALGSAEVKLIDMVRAYGTFGAGGWLADPLIVTSISDRNGKVIYEKRPHQKRVVDEETAFIMANMMKGVVERGTATILKKLEKPVAGKTGTTNDHMDVWFIGFTPEWAFGVWIGFDRKRTIGKQETGGKTAAPVVLYFLEEFLKDSPPIDFDIPDGVTPVAVDLNSGRQVDPAAPEAFIDYFKSGTEPVGGGSVDEVPQEYLSNDEF